MSIKTLVQEAMNKNALGFEATLKEELSNRVRLALESKMNGEENNDDEAEEQSDDAVNEK